VHVRPKNGTVVSTETIDDPTPRFGKQIQAAIGARIVTVRIDGIATNQLLASNQSIDVVRAVEEPA
jgi:hypothetical protein